MPFRSTHHIRSARVGRNNQRAFRRMIEGQISQGGNEIARYRYDTFGQRISKTTQSGTTYYDYDPAGQLLNQSDTPANYVYLDGEPLARVDYWPYDWSGSVQYWPIHYYHNNPVGAPLKTSSNYRNVTWNAQLDPFGKAQSINPTITQNLRFPGQYYDAETGWHYNMQRYYDPDTGRYLQSDPIGLRGGVNTYAYAYNNPLRWTDPLGLFVTGNYDSQTGLLTVTDQDTGNSVTIQAESGGKPVGDPIPTGTYDVLERQGRPDFYRLDKQDSSPYDDVDTVTGRNHFRLHRPGRTVGCIAAQNSQGWKQVDELIKNTNQTDTVPDNFKPWWKFWPTEQQELRRYGTLTVH